MAKNKIKNLYNLIENVAADILKSEFGMSDEQIAAEKDKIATQAPQAVQAAMAKANVATQQSLEHSAQNWRTAAAGYRAATAATREAKDVLVPQAQNLAALKKGLAADTAATVGKIKSGEIKPGTPEWESMEQRTANLTSGVTPSTASYRNPKITPGMVANLPVKDIGPMREKLKQTTDEKAKMAAQAAQKAAGEKVVSTVLDVFKQNVNENTVTEESYLSMDNIKQAIKKSIVQNFIAEAKMKDGPGKTSQRPKSWDKGTKAGSEKRKMREQGKREARDMQEGVSDFFGTDSEGNTRGLGRNYGVEHELDVTPGAEMTHIQHFEHVDPRDPSKGIQYRKGSKLARHGIPVALLNTSTLLPKSGAEAEFAKLPNALKYLQDVKNYHWGSYSRNVDARRSGLKGAGANVRYHTQMGIATKTLMEKIRGGQQTSSLTEGESWGPELGGSSQDDATARAYEEQRLEADRTATPKTHKDVMKELSAAHEAALSHAYTAATMGKTKLSPKQMRDLYHKHFGHIMGSD